MNPIQIEKLQKEAAKDRAALQSEKKKSHEFKTKYHALKSKSHALKSQIQTLKKENRQLNKKLSTLEGKLSRSKEQEERSKQILQEELKKTFQCNGSSTTYCKASIYRFNRTNLRGNVYESPYQF